VHEHAPLEYAHALGAGPDTGRMIMGHALELAHRLPLLWARVVAGGVEAWRARQVATQTIALSADVAAKVDELLAETNRVINKATAEDLVTEALLVCDPDEAARREAAAQD